jgi:hypothetical protein
LLSHALIVSHDATVGYWNGETNQTVDLGHKKNNLDYLSPDRRMQVLFGELASWFSVDGWDSTTAVSVDRHKIATLTIPHESVFREQLKLVRNHADLRSDRQAEITVQQSDIMSFFGAMGHLNSSRRKYTIEMLHLTYNIAAMIAQQVKHRQRAPRPVDYDSRIQPTIQTPDHSSFPSGHAVEAFAVAYVLKSLMDCAANETSAVEKLAVRIAANRVVAGVHFPIDNAAGALLGHQIGRGLMALVDGGKLYRLSYSNPPTTTGKKEKKHKEGKAKATAPIFLAADKDFTRSWFETYVRDNEGELSHASAPQPPLFAHFYAQALHEWGGPDPDVPVSADKVEKDT